MQRESNVVETTERSVSNDPHDHRELREMCMRKPVSWLSYCTLIKNLLSVCSGTGDCERHQGEALLCGFGF